MGSFSSVCSFTNLPVQDGDKVYVFYVAATTFMDTLSEFKPICFPIAGTYNDYGDIENITQDFNHSFFMEEILPKFSEITLTTVRATDPLHVFKDEVRIGHQVCPDSWTPGKTALFDTEENSSGKMVHKLKQSNGSTVRQIFVHASVLDEMVEMGLNTKINWSDDKLFTSLYHDIDRVIVACKFVDDTDFGFSFRGTLNKELGDNHPFNCIFKQTGEGGFPIPFLSRAVTDCMDTFIDWCKTDEGKAKHFLWAYVKQRALTRIMMNTNRTFQPFVNNCTQYQEEDEAQHSLRLLELSRKIQQQKLDEIQEIN